MAEAVSERSDLKMNLDKLKTTQGVDVKDKRVLVRADLNVPVKDGKVTDATRLERLVPGLKDLAERGAKVIVISHFGRPKSGPEPEFSLQPVAASLSALLGQPIAFGSDCIGGAGLGSTGRRGGGGARLWLGRSRGDVYTRGSGPVGAGPSAAG